MKKLGDCLELIHHQNDEILSRDAEVSRLKTEIVKMKLAFAEKTIQEYEKSQAVGRPSGLSSHISAARYLRPSYASIARSEAPPVLIAHLADGAGDEVIDIAKVDHLLDSKTNGPVPLHVKKKDNNLLITFTDCADLDRAADVMRSKPDCTSMFKSVSEQNVLFPMVALSVDVSDTKQLQSEIVLRNPSLKDKVHSIRTLYTKPNTNTGHVKILLNNREVRDDFLFRGRVFANDSSHRVVEIDLNREVRRCYKCQKYGHIYAESVQRN